MTQEQPKRIFAGNNMRIGDEKDGGKDGAKEGGERLENNENLHSPERSNGHCATSGVASTGTTGGEQDNKRGDERKDAEVKHQQGDTSTRLRRVGAIWRDEGDIDNRHRGREQLRNRADQRNQREPAQRPEWPLRRRTSRVGLGVKGNQ